MTPAAWTRAWSGLLLVGLTAVAYLLTVPPDDDSVKHSTVERRLVPFPVSALSGLVLVHRDVTHEFQRDSEGQWYQHRNSANHTHAADAKQTERIAEVITMLGETRIERTVETGPGSARFGTASPELIVMLYRTELAEPVRRILVGDVAPDTLARYVHLQEEQSTVTIPNYQVENLRRLLVPSN